MKTNTPTILTEDALREAFWADHPALRQLREDGRDPRDVRQNQQRPDVRTAFVDYVDCLARSGHITLELAQTATL